MYETETGLNNKQDDILKRAKSQTSSWFWLCVASDLCPSSDFRVCPVPHRATIRSAFLLLLVATSTWLCGLMAVNNSILAFYYIFNVLCLVQVTPHLCIYLSAQSLRLIRVSLCQGVCVLLVFTVFNAEVKEAWRVVCLGKKSPGEEPPRPPQNNVRTINMCFS